MRKQNFLKIFMIPVLAFTLFACAPASKENTETKKEPETTLTVEERVENLSKAFDVGLEDYSSYYKDENIKKCLMSTTGDIMYSYVEYDTKDNAKKKFEEGMNSYKDDVLLENKQDSYHLYEIQRTLKTSTVTNGKTIDKVVNSKEKDAKNVKYTTYNVLEGKAIVSIMAPTDNNEDLEKALETMNYKAK